MAELDILIPHYNDPLGLALSLESIAGQGWKGKKHAIVYDDGSGPDQFESVQKIAAHMPFPVTLLRGEKNLGRPFARNALLAALQSPYAAWLDAGDEWYPEKLAAQFRAIEGQKSDKPYWITCNYLWRWQHGKERKVRQQTAQDQVRALLTGTTLRAYLWTLLAPSHFFTHLGGFDENLPRLQDLDFFLRFVAAGGRLVNAVEDSEEPLCVYHKSDIGRNAQEVHACGVYIFDKHRALYERYGARFVQNRLYDLDMHAARFAFNNGDMQKKRMLMARALKKRPLRFLRHFVRRGLNP